MQKELIEKNPILKLTIDFSLLIIEYCEKLEGEKRFVIAKQLLRSGTSIGANSMEAQNSESKADFIHKFKIAAKEADETQYWLTLCNYAPSYPDCNMLFEKLEEIQKVLNKILGTAKRKTPISYLLSYFIFN
ncbi:MAG: four helix bundle protein [Bacteroidota bacterium]|nr:four helix bundle protein [Bacteroidota bacterium]